MSYVSSRISDLPHSCSSLKSQSNSLMCNAMGTANLDEFIDERVYG